MILMACGLLFDFNKVNKNVYLCRDRLGEKPLYYFQFNKGI